MRGASSKLAKTLAILGAPDAVRVSLAGKETAAAATGRAVWSRAQGLVFNANQLPQLPAGRVYQLWVLAPKPVSVGVLTVAADGTATMTASLDAGLPPVDAVAVTAEPGPNGSAGPTMPIPAGRRGGEVKRWRFRGFWVPGVPSLLADASPLGELQRRLVPPAAGAFGLFGFCSLDLGTLRDSGRSTRAPQRHARWPRLSGRRLASLDGQREPATSLNQTRWSL